MLMSNCLWLSAELGIKHKFKLHQKLKKLFANEKLFTWVEDGAPRLLFSMSLHFLENIHRDKLLAF